jgi:hypothetical protein
LEQSPIVPDGNFVVWGFHAMDETLDGVAVVVEKEALTVNSELEI